MIVGMLSALMNADTTGWDKGMTRAGQGIDKLRGDVGTQSAGISNALNGMGALAASAARSAAPSAKSPPPSAPPNPSSSAPSAPSPAAPARSLPRSLPPLEDLRRLRLDRFLCFPRRRFHYRRRIQPSQFPHPDPKGGHHRPYRRPLSRQRRSGRRRQRLFLPRHRPRSDPRRHPSRRRCLPRRGRRPPHAGQPWGRIHQLPAQPLRRTRRQHRSDGQPAAIRRRRRRPRNLDVPFPGGPRKPLRRGGPGPRQYAHRPGRAPARTPPPSSA